MKCYKKAFTMIELIMIIVVVGILAVAVIPRVDRDTLVEATNQVASHVRYTQHLAMLDNKYNPRDSNWYRNRWKITFNNNSYSITSGNTNAKNPQAPGKDLNPTGSPELNLERKYGITSIISTCGNNGQTEIIFDEIGRPYSNFLGVVGERGLLQNDCNITISDGGNKNGIITISKETGYIAHSIQ
ncbi:pilus assembly FimT family protein [Campylobacter ureolyticus]|uniref:Type II secretion system protein n=1 Tax=Campylobacter ureolyticus TaxID=827 RepID=A0A381E5I9_9BACT|nr:type II secretion system protein [Campylobacter ureolyticus]MCR8685147.1 type II secretion system GspH family protein [Campylobacter ureolyticus]MCZ6103951.1 type II secretion system protein [Campylobacter ureolyticus]MCZ6135231.1 type II secretion system protein [Campylobacter ureolyticus]MCZ6162271.1 type II secretion system protein [Campylobacter ureolyticus]MCZ6171107.1 type II secretion system protein [Campylobacter ureolyticus]